MLCKKYIWQKDNFIKKLTKVVMGSEMKEVIFLTLFFVLIMFLAIEEGRNNAPDFDTWKKKSRAEKINYGRKHFCKDWKKDGTTSREMFCGGR